MTGRGPARLQPVDLPSGTSLHWLEAGRGQPVLLLHGGMGDCSSWGPQVEALAGSFRAIAYSRRHSYPNVNPAAGACDAPQDDVEDLHQLAAVLRLQRFHLVGTSYGALVALAYATVHPERILGLVLCEPPLHAWTASTPDGAALVDRFMSTAWAPAAAAFRRGDDRIALRLLVDAMWGMPTFCRLSGHRLATVLRNARAMEALTRSPEPFPDLPRPRVANLAARMLLVQGEHTSVLHRCAVSELARTAPEAARVVVHAAGHAAPLENPGQFNARLLEFLAGVALSAGD